MNIDIDSNQRCGLRSMAFTNRVRGFKLWATIRERRRNNNWHSQSISSFQSAPGARLTRGLESTPFRIYEAESHSSFVKAHSRRVCPWPPYPRIPSPIAKDAQRIPLPCWFASKYRNLCIGKRQSYHLVIAHANRERNSSLSSRPQPLGPATWSQVYLATPLVTCWES